MNMTVRSGIVGAAVLCLLLLFMAPAEPRAESPDALFVNMTTDDGHRAAMGIGFGYNQLLRGHPLTVFLNTGA